MNENKEIKDKMLEINQIFDELISDAVGLSKDLVISIKQWLLSSAFWFLGAGLYFWYLTYPTLISGNLVYGIWYILGTVLVCILGFYSIWKYFDLKKKYARLFAIQEALSKEK